jgi:hypothetical protein
MSTVRSAGDDTLARLFAASPRHFAGSPLYSRLGQVVAADGRLLAIATQARTGQLPPNLLFASVHYLLMRDSVHELAAWYPSLGGIATGDPGPAFTAFCLDRRAEIVALMRRRLVQSNVVKRSLVLRAGLAAVASMTREPVTLVEVGCVGKGVLIRGRIDGLAGRGGAARSGPRSGHRGPGGDRPQPDRCHRPRREALASCPGLAGEHRAGGTAGRGAEGGRE